MTGKTKMSLQSEVLFDFKLAKSEGTSDIRERVSVRKERDYLMTAL